MKACFKALFLVLLVAFGASQPYLHRLDLQRLLSEPNSLEQTVITYNAADQNGVMFVFGDGKVITQPKPSLLNNNMVVTCSARIQQEDVRELIRLMIEKKFFDLPERNYLVLYAAMEDDPFEAMKLHTIRIKSDEGAAQRSFGTGKYGAEQLSIPDDFAVIERKLIQLRDQAYEAVKGKPCRFAPPVKDY